MGRRQDNHLHRHHHDAAAMVNSSSIALLQERFKQLERVKERREGKELLKLFSSSSSDSSSSSSSSSSSALQFQASEHSFSPQAPHHQNHRRPNIHGSSLSLGLNQQADHHRPHQGALASNFEHSSDVDHIDTSLHL